MFTGEASVWNLFSGGNYRAERAPGGGGEVRTGGASLSIAPGRPILDVHRLSRAAQPAARRAP
jgi:hypothetical protein